MTVDTPAPTQATSVRRLADHDRLLSLVRRRPLTTDAHEVAITLDHAFGAHRSVCAVCGPDSRSEEMSELESMVQGWLAHGQNPRLWQEITQLVEDHVEESEAAWASSTNGPTAS